MPGFLQNLPIQRKLSLIIMVACLPTLVLACAALFGFESYRLTKTFANDVAALAEVVAANSTGPVAFHDQKAAAEMLAALKGKPQIKAAFISLPDRTVFARLGGTEGRFSLEAFPLERGFRYAGNDLFLSQPIISDGETLGVLHLWANVKAMRNDLLKLYAGTLGLVLAGSLLLAFLLSTRLQRIISVPILRLGDTARSIAEHKDYSVRATKLGRDEVGLLTDAFNLMLTQIQVQDDALQKARQQLEQQVAALGESEARYRSVVNNVKEVVFQTDAAGLWTLLNPAWVEITGFSIEESLGRNFTEFLHLDDRASVRHKFQMLIQARQQSTQQEVRYLTKSGGLRWVEINARLLADPSGALIGATGVLHDITERKHTQAELEVLNRRLIDTSRRAGMAEIATNVLHNVGNVLNSVNVSADLIVEDVKRSRISSLARVVVLLREHAHDLGEFITQDPKGKHVPALLAQLSDHLQSDQTRLVEELQSLRQNIEHIKEIVAMQQNYAMVVGVKEMISVVQLVEDSLRINEGALNRHHVEVIRQFSTVPPMNIEKHKVLQILVNLVRNAKYACQESGRADLRLTVCVANSDGKVKISVQDNGVGIPTANLTRIFSHGFTTRKGGHGFGLHSSALAAKEMGGSLTVHSDGPGKGAVFTLELPLSDARGSS